MVCKVRSVTVPKGLDLILQLKHSSCIVSFYYKLNLHSSLLTSFSVHEFLGTFSCGYLWMNLLSALSVSCLLCECFNCENAVNHIHNCKINMFRPQGKEIWASRMSTCCYIDHTVSADSRSDWLVVVMLDCRQNCTFYSWCCYISFFCPNGHVIMLSIWIWSEGNSHATACIIASILEDSETGH